MTALIRAAWWAWLWTSVGLTSSTQPASKPAERLDPQADAILQRLEQRGQSIDDLSARLTWELFDEIVEERQVRHGQVFYRRDKPNARFLIRFDDLVIGGRIRPQKEWHLFDGQWYIEKRELTKSVIKRQVVPPGRTIDPFKLGQGPFPLPFGQKKADILRYFRVEWVGPAKGDPPDSDHLRLLPRPGTEMAQRYRRLEFYIDRQSDLPVRVRIFQRDDKIVTVSFADLAANTGLAGSRFELDVPKDWELTVEPLPPEPMPRR